MQKLIVALLLLSGTNAVVNAADHYISDIWGQHSCIEFRVTHLELSWPYGRFNEFEDTTIMNLKEWGITYPLPDAEKAGLPCRSKAFASTVPTEARTALPMTTVGGRRYFGKVYSMLAR